MGISLDLTEGTPEDIAALDHGLVVFQMVGISTPQVKSTSTCTPSQSDFHHQNKTMTDSAHCLSQWQ